MRAFESQGLWYLPGESERVVAGTLRFSANEGLRLSLTGTLREVSGSAQVATYDVIHGVVRESPYGRLVTLIDCFQRSATLAIPGFASEEIRANRAYLGGRHMDSETTFTVASTRASFSGLSEWAGITGFQGVGSDHKDVGELHVRYRRPQPVELRLDGHAASIEADVSASRSGNALSMAERVYIALSLSERRMPQQVLREYVIPFQDFLTFVGDRPAALEELTFTEAAPERPDPLYLCFQPVYGEVEQSRAPSAFDMLFTWPGIRASHSDILALWYVFRRRYDSACDIYFGLQYAPPTYVEARFLLAWHALALFLAPRSNIDLAPRVGAELMKELSRVLHAQWLDVLPTTEELSAPSSTLKLMQDYGDLLVPIIGDNPEIVVAKLLATRRHLFHHDPAADAAKTSLAVFHLFEIIRFLIKVVMLEHLGFSKTEITDVLSRARQYAWLLSFQAGGTSQ